MLSHFSSFQFSHSVVSDSLRPCGLQHSRLPCPSPTPRACSNSCPSSQWCHPTISSSFFPSFCLQSFPASGSFLMSDFFTSSGQSIGASASVLSMDIQDLFPFRMDWLDLFAVQGTLKSLLQHHSSEAPILQCSACFMVQLSHPYMTTGKKKNMLIIVCFPDSSVGKESTCHAGDPGLIPGLGRSTGEGIS